MMCVWKSPIIRVQWMHIDLTYKKYQSFQDHPVHHCCVYIYVHFSRTLKLDRCQPALLWNLILLRCRCHCIDCFLSTLYAQKFWYLQQVSFKNFSWPHTATVQIQTNKIIFLIKHKFQDWDIHTYTHTHTLTRTHIYIHTHPYIHTTYVHTFSTKPQTAPVPLNSPILHYCICIVVSPQSAPVSQQAIIPTVPHPNQHTAFTAKLS